MATRGFKKGNPGKPKGAVSKKTLMWDELGSYIVNGGAERYMKCLAKIRDPEYMKRFEVILEYFKPRQQRTSLTDGDGNNLNMPLIFYPAKND